MADQEKQPAGKILPPTRRTREDVLREIKLALTVGDGMLLDQRERSRGRDPYDSVGADPAHKVWNSRCRD